VAKPTGRIGFRDGMKSVPNAVDEPSPSASAELSQERFGLGPGELDRVEVRGIGRKEFKSSARGFDREANFEVAVNAEVVPDDDVAGSEQRREELTRPNTHRFGVHGAWQEQWGVDTVEREGGDDAEGLPAPAGDVINESLAAGSPARSARQREIDAALVHEPKSSFAPALAPLRKQLAGANYVRSLTFRGLEGLFFRVSPSRRRLRHIVVSLTDTSVASANNFDSSTSDASGRFSASLRRRFSVDPLTSLSLPGAFPGAGSPVRWTCTRSFRTKLGLTANRRPTRSDELSSSSASKIRLRMSTEIAVIPDRLTRATAHGKGL
jgi:hypothetical protein